VSTMSGSDVVAALARLEEMGVSRSEIVEGTVCVVAQRLLRRLCPACRRIEPPTEQERAHLAEFVDGVPETVAHPVGCPECGMSGYRGRVGVFEILQMTDAIAGMLRTDAPISDVGAVIRQRSGCSLCESAVEKVREHVLAPLDVHEQILSEAGDSARRVEAVGNATGEAEASVPVTLLVVDDSDDTRDLIAATLNQEGYEVVVARNGVEALHFLGARHFDLVLSDLNMPLMGGFDLFERYSRGESVPAAVLYSASTKDSDEVRSLEMGAIDYVRLPASPAVVRLRVRRALEIVRLRLREVPDSG
ncbi:MAG: response regulator, partial [Coriobacteriia bacterium]|nr:response regulator [Coriobacteriia bacterium]